ncbi:MAG TPA: LysR family transcriptional regulator [Stellaceae bacterium]|nr:LysR family transcriptional regulator [Stellaceae bacterium]
MELYQIAHFAAVAETGSFTKAAIRAALSQPALSASCSHIGVLTPIASSVTGASPSCDRR